jgi:hypothetical protein
MGICWRIRAAAGPVCPRRVSTSCPQGIPPTPGGGGAGDRDDLEERPLPVALLPNHLCQHRLKRRDAKKPDDSEAFGVVTLAPTATAAIYENPDPGVSNAGKRFADAVSGIAPNRVEMTHGDNRHRPLLYGNCRPQI